MGSWNEELELRKRIGSLAERGRLTKNGALCRGDVKDGG